MNEQRITEIINRLDSVSEKVKHHFSGLSGNQLNARLSPESWSIAQCLDHLMVSNRSYFAQLEAIISGNPHGNLWKKFPVLPKFFGNLLRRSVSPEEKKKFRTMDAFRPAASSLPEDIVERFLVSQKELGSLIFRLGKTDLQKEKVTSPAARFITYSLDDLLEIIVLHEERHLEQAKRIKSELSNTD